MNTDLVDISELSVYTIAEEWAKEAGVSVDICLHRLAKAIMSPPPDQHPLLLKSGQLQGASSRALKWLSEAVPSFHENMISKDLNDVRVNRNDFLDWCILCGHQPPRFWFPSQAGVAPAAPLETRLADIVRRLFWSEPPPEGHNRPTQKQIVAWLIEYAETDGLTEKAAGRIYTTTKPGHIPKHGNLPQSKKPYPTPPFPSR